MTKSRKEKDEEAYRELQQQAELLKNRISRVRVSLNRAKAEGEKEEAETLLEMIDERWTRLQVLFEDILKVVSDADRQAEMVSQEDFRDDMTRLRVEALRVIKTTASASNIQAVSTATIQTPDQANRLPGQAIAARLPRLELKTFKGNYADWMPWWGAFEAAVDTNTSLHVVDKFNFLRLYTEGEAAASIAGLALTAANYPVAVNTLKERFGRTEAIQSAHISGILRLPEVTKITDVKGMRKLFDESQIHIRSLESLGVAEATYSAFVKPVLLAKMPVELSIEWHKQDNVEAATLPDLVKYLRKEIESRELSFMMRSKAENQKGGANQNQQHQNPKPTVEEASGSTRQLAAIAKGSSGRKDKKKIRKDFKCLFCDEEHYAVQCEVPIDKKWQQVKNESRCIQCLGKNHKASECRSARPCKSCGEAHHTALCKKRTVKSKDETAKETESKTKAVSACAHVTFSSEVFLMTTTAIIYGLNAEKKVTGFLDGGATRSFVGEELVEALGLEFVGQAKFRIQVFGEEGSDEPRLFKRYKLRIRGTFPEAALIEMEAYSVPKICTADPYLKTNAAKQLWMKNYRLADDRYLSSTTEETKFKILIGADYYWKFVENETISFDDGLTAVSSKLGWLLHGPSQPSQDNNQSVVFGMLANVTSRSINPNQLKRQEASPVSVLAVTTSSPSDPEKEESESEDFDLRAFWAIEHFGIKDEGGGQLDVDPLADYQDRISRNPEGRYQAPLPWKEGGKERLHTNREMAECRLKSLLNKLAKTPRQRDEYHLQLKKYIEEGFVEEADFNYQGIHTYLPHRPVYREDKETTKVRPVFDGSARTKTSPSINECLLAGPNLNPELFEAILRFQTRRIAWIADIEKAFLQIELAPEDAEVVRFLWVEDPSDPKSPIKAYKWTRITFGLTSSPFVLRSVIIKHVKQFVEMFPETVKMILEQLYVDDLLGGADDLETAIKRIEETIFIFSEAKMILRKWLTNDPRLQQHFSGDQQWDCLEGALGQAMTNTEAAKVLGLGWDPKKDEFLFNPDGVLEEVKDLKGTPTKRQILRISSRIFDPLGLLGPVVLLVKILFQQLWEKAIKWDQEVPEETDKQWRLFIEGLVELRELRLPRWIQSSSTDQAELHVFGDASEAAYGAVAYVRLPCLAGSAHTQLLCCKTRVAPLPLKSVSLPRLELLASLLAANLADYVVKAIHSIKWRVYMWTDSMVALGWIQGDIERWKQFVRNRVAEIRKLVNPEWWRHCPGVDNPADLASRGASVSTIINTDLWRKGPSWLSKEEEEWPGPSYPPDAVETVKEVLLTEAKAVKERVLNTQVLHPPAEWDISRIHSFHRLVRVTAWLNRFVRHLKQQRPKADPTQARTPVSIKSSRRRKKVINVECLSATEVEEAETQWIRSVQREAFPEFYFALSTSKPIRSKSKILDLRPLWDSEMKCIRVVGRIELALADRKVKPPILLPADHPIVDLIIMQAHHRVLHSGVKSTLTELRERYWCVRGRQQVKRVLHRCVTCNRHHARHFDAAPATLPLARIKETNPFEVTGVDFAGPLYVRPTRKKKRKGKPKPPPPTEEKVYICLFTCAVTRAIHLELVPNLEASTFILALRKFLGRRCGTSVLYSDNAKTFKKAMKLIKVLRANPHVNDFLSTKRMEWKFSANLAPWWGGWFERMVRTTKELLRKTVGRATLEYGEMEAMLVDVEAAINDRPLTYVAEGDGEPQPLTPSMLLHGKRITSLPEKPAPEINEDSSSREVLLGRHIKLRRVLAHFWKRWQKEYLEDLSRFHAKGRQTRPIEVGEVVLIHEANTKRQLWPMGVVTSLIPGKQGQARAAWIRTQTGHVTNRPIQNLFPLELKVAAEGETADLSPAGREVNQPNISRKGRRRRSRGPKTPTDSNPSIASARPPEHVGNPRVIQTRAGRIVKLPSRYSD